MQCFADMQSHVNKNFLPSNWLVSIEFHTYFHICLVILISKWQFGLFVLSEDVCCSQAIQYFVFYVLFLN